MSALARLRAAAFRVKAARDEAMVKRLLCGWVSELEPAVAYDHRGEIIGLVPADTLVGTEPTIFNLPSKIQL